MATKDINVDELKQKYGGTVLVIETDLSPTDEETVERNYYFKKVPVMAVSRYLKNGANNQEKAAKNLVIDCICDESKDQFMNDLEKFPLLALSIAEKLLTSQGFSKSTVLKKLS